MVHHVQLDFFARKSVAMMKNAPNEIFRGKSALLEAKGQKVTRTFAVFDGLRNSSLNLRGLSSYSSTEY